MTHIMKATTAADFLAMLPHLLGYRPRNSLVVVMFDGKRNSAMMRYDLPPTPTHEISLRIARMIVEVLTKLPRGQDVVIAVYTDKGFGRRTVAPYSPLVRLLMNQIKNAGFSIRDAMCAAADGYGSYLDPEVPTGGWPVRDIEESTVADDLSEEDRADEGDGRNAPIAWASDEVKAFTSRAIDELNAIPDGSYGSGAPMTEVSKRYEDSEGAEDYEDSEDSDDAEDYDYDASDVPLFMESALGWSDEEIMGHSVFVLWMLQAPPFRDYAMLHWATNLQVGDRVFDQVVVRNGGPGDIDLDIAGMMVGAGPSPDFTRVRAAIELLVKLVGLVEDRHRPAPLAMLAWLNWAQGRGSRAGGYLDVALAIDPGYGMAHLLNTLVSSGRPPEWAYAS